jgi:hypothetical protein
VDLRAGLDDLENRKILDTLVNVSLIVLYLKWKRNFPSKSRLTQDLQRRTPEDGILKY